MWDDENPETALKLFQLMTVRLDYAEFMQWLYVDSNQKFREHVFKKRVVLGAWCVDPHGCFWLWNKALKSEGNINDPQEVICTFCWWLDFQSWKAMRIYNQPARPSLQSTLVGKPILSLGDTVVVVTFFGMTTFEAPEKLPQESYNWLAFSFSVSEIGIISLWYLKRKRGVKMILLIISKIPTELWIGSSEVLVKLNDHWGKSITSMYKRESQTLAFTILLSSWPKCIFSDFTFCQYLKLM